MELTAKEFTEQISVIANTIHDEFNKLSKLVSKTDIAIQDILHKIEFDEFSKEEAFRFALQIKEIRQERRTYKNDIDILHTLVRVLEINKINKAVKKINSRYKEYDKLSTVFTETNRLEVAKVENNQIHETNNIQNDLESKRPILVDGDILLDEHCDKQINHMELNLKQEYDKDMERRAIQAIREMTKKLRFRE